MKKSSVEVLRVVVLLEVEQKSEVPEANPGRARPKLKQSRAALKRRAARGGFRVDIDERITGRGW